MEQSDQPGAVVSSEGLGLVERLRQCLPTMDDGPDHKTWCSVLGTDLREAADEIERLRADLVSCRGTVKADRNHYERLAEVHRGRPTFDAYEAEAQRLDALLERIDGLMGPNVRGNRPAHGPLE